MAEDSYFQSADNHRQYQKGQVSKSICLTLHNGGTNPDFLDFTANLHAVSNNFWRTFARQIISIFHFILTLVYDSISQMISTISFLASKIRITYLKYLPIRESYPSTTSSVFSFVLYSTIQLDTFQLPYCEQNELLIIVAPCAATVTQKQLCEELTFHYVIVLWDKNCLTSFQKHCSKCALQS